MQIGEVARRSGVSARMLRHYDALGLVRPSVRSAAGYREYTDSDIRRIFHVESLRSLGLSLKDVARALDEPAFDPAALVADLVARTEHRIRLETELLRRLAEVAATGPEDWTSVLATVSVMNELTASSPGIRQRAAMSASDAVASPDALAAAVLREDNRNVAGALRWALAQSGSELPAAVHDALASDDPVVRRRASETAIELGVDGAVLAPLLDDGDRGLAASVAIELGRRGDRTALPYLVRLVRRDGQHDVAAAESLGCSPPIRRRGAISSPT